MTLLELLEYVKAGGAPLAVVFAILWWLERDERKDAQAELKLLTRDAVTSIAKTEAGFGNLVAIFKNNGSR